MGIFQRLHRPDWTRSEQSLKEVISFTNTGPLAQKMHKYLSTHLENVICSSELWQTCASAFWSQLKADACDRTIVVPVETQSVCRGAAVIGLVEAGILSGIEEAESLAPISTKVYTPSHSGMHKTRYERFQRLRDALYITAQENDG